MAAGFSAPSRKGASIKAQYWFQRNGSRLLATGIVCIMLLFFMHLLTSTLDTLAPQVVIAIQAAAIIPGALIALSVLWKGPVPLIVAILGIVLMNNAIMLPYYSAEQRSASQFEDVSFGLVPQTVTARISMHFFLGAAMAAFSMIIAYRPSVLFTRNRPQSQDSEWSQYPVWHDSVLLADGRKEPSVPVKSLLTDQDRCLLWRYEYVLASVYGTPHLVRPQGMVPKGSSILRDKESGRVMGKARYTGYFV